MSTATRRSPASAAGTAAAPPATAAPRRGRRTSRSSAPRSGSSRDDPRASDSPVLASRLVTPSRALPDNPPFVLRARLLTPLATGGTRHEPDALIEVDGRGRITSVATAADRPEAAVSAIDIRPWVVLPGMVDLHAHLPQLPNAGLGAGLDLLTWLERYIFPLEREFHADAAARLAPVFYRALAAAGTTTALLYGAVFEDSVDAAFAAAEDHGIRVVLGKVMMDRFRYDESLADSAVLDRSVAESQRLI